VKRLSKKYNKAVESVSREVMQKIRAYPWPGNVRELENILERSLLFATGKEMSKLDLDFSAGSSNKSDWRTVREDVIARAERPFLENALKQHQGDIKKTAEDMGMTSRAVYIKLKKYQINLMDFRRA
jgi:two-component system response regulator HydG